MKISPPKNDEKLLSIMYWKVEWIEKALKLGWHTIYPPQDFKGSMTNWVGELARKGYFKDIHTTLIPTKIWQEVLKYCENLEGK